MNMHVQPLHGFAGRWQALVLTGKQRYLVKEFTSPRP
jgi:hypothetical protein